MPDDNFDPQPQDDRRRVPDVFSYRLGAVEQLSTRNAEELNKLERIVNELVSGMPSRFATRREFDKLVDRLGELSTHLETFVATANASNAIREHNQDQNRTIRLQWPVWALMVADTIIAALALLHHG